MSGLELKNIVKRYGQVTVVQQLNLSVAAGEFLVLLGESGCGKSTTLRMIAGLEPVTDGQIFIGEHDVTNMPPMSRDIAMVFQNYALYPHMDVAQNMSFALKLTGRPQSEIDQRVATAANVLNIEHLLKRRPKELSGGQRQRVAIGRAIVREPKVFLFDEPLSNLDAKLRGHMRAELVLLHQRLAKTTVYVTHDQVEAMTLANRIVIFDKGRIQQVGTPSEVFNQPATVFVASFIGTPTMNLLNARSAEHNGALVLEGDGFSFLAPPWLRGQLTSTDQKLTVGIRPQALKLVQAPQPTALQVDVSVVEYLGAESQVIGTLVGANEQKITATIPQDAHSLLRSRVALTADPSDLHIFDQATGITLLA